MKAKTQIKIILGVATLMLASCVYPAHGGAHRAPTRPAGGVVVASARTPQVTIQYIQRLPGRYTTFAHHGRTYYHCNGRVYQRSHRGYSVVAGVVAPRPQVHPAPRTHINVSHITHLPGRYTTFRQNGRTYYQCDGRVYQKGDRGYTVTRSVVAPRKVVETGRPAPPVNHGREQAQQSRNQSTQYVQNTSKGKNTTEGDRKRVK